MIGKFNVDALFLQFIASGILELKLLNDGLTWVLGKTTNPNNTRETLLNYKKESSWYGFAFQ